ncbi:MULTISPECIES: hypothetical protein [unclassified Streptomyces]|uniref:hypothetical protein n=1 Tax=unclassified Streptomyces TaxID=2593676 RepID=UPI0033A5B9FD
MNRITIYETDEYTGEQTRVGHFDLDAATVALKEDDQWDGNNMRGKVSGMQINRAYLYRTAGGRWVEHSDHRPEFNGPNIWRFLSDDEAREWMLKSGDTEAEEALAKYFPETPEEDGPAPKGGRPAIGGPVVPVQYPRDLLNKVDAAAKTAGMSRAAWLRKIAEDAVA